MDGTRFIYGGANQDAGADYGDVWVLSLPGFHWTKVRDDVDGKRNEHACVAVKSSLLSFGGIEFVNEGGASNNEAEAWKTKDAFSRGIGIFDMNTLEWRESYNADAPDYRTHDRIKSWYEG